MNKKCNVIKKSIINYYLYKCRNKKIIYKSNFE